MKIMVRDVTSGKCNVRNYLDYDEETDCIYVIGSELDTVLIDRSEAWEKVERERQRYREAIEEVLMIENYGVATDYIEKVESILNEALECTKHHMLRCSECEQVDDLKKQNQRYREYIEQAYFESTHPDLEYSQYRVQTILNKVMKEEVYNGK